MTIHDDDDLSLGGDARRMLVAANQAGGDIRRADYDQPVGPSIEAGASQFDGPPARLALEELMEKGLVRHEGGALYRVTRLGAEVAAVELASEGDATTSGD